MNNIDVEILFNSSKRINPQINHISFDKYEITSIPTMKESLDDSSENLILSFKDTWEPDQMASNPEKEADFILSILSLVANTKIKFDSTKINNVQIAIRKKRSYYLNGTLDMPDINHLFLKLYSLDNDVLRQYLRSCASFKTSLLLIDDNPTLSFFLLVTAIEAIANKVVDKGSISEKFLSFIKLYCSHSIQEEFEDHLFTLLIKQAYRMRSAFTHGGTEISLGTLSADRLERAYVKHYIKGKETFSPSLRWFQSVVQSTLLEFLKSKKNIYKNDRKLEKLALEEGILYFKAKKSIKAGQMLTKNDVELNL